MPVSILRRAAFPQHDREMKNWKDVKIAGQRRGGGDLQPTLERHEQEAAGESCVRQPLVRPYFSRKWRLPATTGANPRREAAEFFADPCASAIKAVLQIGSRMFAPANSCVPATPDMLK
jgi:hypothetical protein